jgi:hypothetical protein
MNWIEMVLALPFAAFSPELLRKVRSDQGNACADCGTVVEPLQVHHIVPQRYYGRDVLVNAVALCHECHGKWDARSEEGILYPGVGYGEVDPHCFANPQVRNRIIEKFSAVSPI